jgi:hypothetical protein
VTIHPDQIRLGDVAVKSIWTCPPSVDVGDPVYQITPGSNECDLADCTDPSKMPADGVVSQKLSSTQCFVTNHGTVVKSGWGLDPDTDYFVGEGKVDIAGNIPSTLGTHVQPIGRAKNSDELIVDIRSVTIL